MRFVPPVLRASWDPKTDFRFKNMGSAQFEAIALSNQAAKKLVKSRPDHPMGYFLLGLVLDREGEEKQAIAAYELAIEKDGKFLDAHKNLAILCHTANPLYQNKVRTKKALEHYALYFELGGKDPELERSYLQMKGFLESMGGR